MRWLDLTTLYARYETSARTLTRYLINTRSGSVHVAVSYTLVESGPLVMPTQRVVENQMRSPLPVTCNHLFPNPNPSVPFPVVQHVRPIRAVQFGQTLEDAGYVRESLCNAIRVEGYIM